ncbi:MAG: phosphoglucosamine mutase [Actinobacteria bacterium]|nr:phosphoglucosamine mutase [Actinomycetota bacterium]
MLTFGTDGVRGVAIDELTPALARDLGRAVARVLRPATVVIGRDTRESGRILESAVVEGCAAEGVPVRLMGVAPTPAVAFAAERHGWIGIAITASHNPWTDNGIKVFAAGGAKLSDAEQIEIERKWHSISTEPTAAAIGTVTPADEVLGEYFEHRVGVVGVRALEGLRVVIDCANGAMSAVAPAVLAAAGATVVAINDAPDGRNINDACGATSPGMLLTAVVANGADLGVAFDGDGDRLVAADASGNLVDGDQLILVAAIDLAARGLLRHRGVAVTVMSNLGLVRELESAGVGVIVTPVGDRSVLAALEENDFVLGGEQSGHIVHRAHATTGDGLLAALLLCESLVRRGAVLADAARLDRYPQVLINVATPARLVDPAADVATEIEAARARLGEDGRVVVRASGTEALVRVMVEARDERIARETAASIADALVSRHDGVILGR